MDLYSKIVLTVIAISLSVIAGGQLTQSAFAQFGSSCGGSKKSACWVNIANEPISVVQ